MRVLCLAGDRTVAYLIKHVLAFEGFAVEVCYTASMLADGLADGAEVIVTAEPLPEPLPGAAVVTAPDPFDADRLARAVRRAAARVAADRVRSEVSDASDDLSETDATAERAPGLA